MAVAVTAPALSAAVVLGAVTTPVVLALAVLLVQGLLVAAWHRSLEVPGAAGGALVAGAAAVAAVALVLADDGDRPLAVLPALLAGAVLAGLGHQLSRRDGRSRLVASLAATLTLAALAVLAAAAVPAQASEGGAPLVAAAAVPAGLVAAALALRGRAGGPGWLDLGAVAAIPLFVAVVVLAFTDLRAGAAVAVAVAAGVASWTASLLAGRTPAPDPSVAAALPLALAGPVAYVLGRLLVG